jgi:hypothetical protein
MDELLHAAERYIETLDWHLLLVRGPGTRSPKAAVYDGWPDFRPAVKDLTDYFRQHPRAGIAINLVVQRNGTGLTPLAPFCYLPGR